MKNTTRILTIATACFFAAVTGLAQSSGDAYKSFKKLRDDKEAKPSMAYSQTLCDAGTAFFVEHSSDTGNCRRVVNDLLSYGTGTLAKDKALRADWYAKLNYAIVDKQHSADDKGKTAFAALAAAVAEGQAIDNPSGSMINEWRSQIDKLTAMPGSQSYTLDREKGFYALISKARDPRVLKIAETQLAELSKSKDKDTANWAKREARMLELRNTPISFAFTAFDGKEFDASKLKRTPALYVFFWSTTAKNAAGELERLMDAYFDSNRRQVEFVAFCCDPEDKRDDVQALIKKAKLKCPVYFDGKGTKGELYQQLCSPGMLSGYLFSNAGMLGETNVKPGDLKKYFR